MGRMSLLVSPELCIGCRGCQTACKEWNQLSAVKTHNRGSTENPPDLTSDTFNKIRYVELPSEKNSVRWLFVSQRCMHCGDAGCMKICPAPGALFKTDEGAVAYDKDKCIGCRLCVTACPFNVPRYDKNNKISKCHLCADRIAMEMAPACAKTCPTGALRYGDRDELMNAAQQAGYAKVYGGKDLDGLGAMYAFMDAPKIYGMNENPAVPEAVVFWDNVLKPLSYLGLAGVVAASVLHYVAFGPKKVGGEEGKKDE
jgi:formate dehydrogenase iron-sulfur subunit